jgi:transcriptional regulator with XRE-family HTH domain
VARKSGTRRKPTLADFLRDGRTQRSISRAELAERIGVSVASVYFWEQGKHVPGDGNLTAVCKALRLPIHEARQLVKGRA